ncbi:MAG TPA: NUDIX hydrolase [Ktedonobacterales bacterium]|nr:NUDIX hydrolase [Ktedonobacterales bacterium]
MISFNIGQAIFNFRVAGVCIHDGHVLVQRSVADDFWFLPGGRVEMMESSEAAIKREMREELKLESDVQVARLLWVVENLFHDDTDGAPNHEIGFYYQVNFDDHPALYDTSKALVATEDTGLYADQPMTFALRWLPLDSLDDTLIYPTFLQKGLQNLPTSVQHIVETDSDR